MQAWIAAHTAATQDEADETGPLVVWPENWAAVDLFLRLQSQWRVTPSGRLGGLRYDAVEAVMRMTGARKRRRLFGELQDMEHAVIEGQADD